MALTVRVERLSQASSRGEGNFIRYSSLWQALQTVDRSGVWHCVKKIRDIRLPEKLDNSSETVDHYCVSRGINIECNDLRYTGCAYHSWRNQATQSPL